MKWFEEKHVHFAVGYEDTFVPQARVGERALDEYDLTQHYQHWKSDLGLAKEAAATMARWGIPWYRVNPERGRWDWSWLDQVADRFVELGVEPIVDLVHYGTPLWLDNQFLNSDYPELVAAYAGAVAERYRGAFNVYTQLNEPLLNIMYCGEFGYWPPYLTGDDGFVKLLRAIGRGIVLTEEAVRAASGEASFVHVEASFRFTGDVGGEHAEAAAHLSERAFIVPDLVTGRIDDDHPLVPYLQRHGFSDADLAWHRDHVAAPEVMGVNYYPALSSEIFEHGVRHSGGPLDPRPRHNDWTAGLEDVLIAYARRYDRPVFLTETCFTGTAAERIHWLDASVDCVNDLRGRGVDVVGYTWWSATDMMEWTYRDGVEPPEAYLLPMGLWDLRLDDAGVYRRVRNSVADRYRHHALAAVRGSDVDARRVGA